MQMNPGGGWVNRPSELEKFSVFSLLNREISRDGFAGDSDHHHKNQQVTGNAGPVVLSVSALCQHRESFF